MKKKKKVSNTSALSKAQQRKLAYQTAKTSIKQQRATNKLNNQMKQNTLAQQKHNRTIELKKLNAQGNIRKHNFALESLRESNRTTRFGMAVNAAKDSSLGLWNGIIGSNKNEKGSSQNKDTTSNTQDNTEQGNGNGYQMVT